MASAFLDFTLKTANEFRTKGDDRGALVYLHDILLGKKKGQVQEYEQIMLMYVNIAVELLALDQLREALGAYRNHIQHFSPESFQVILEALLAAANKKVETAEAVHLIDPLLESVSPAGPSPTLHLNFLWDLYGVLLDLLKTNGKLIPLYVLCVQSALDFCKRKRLKNELAKLAQALHGHLQTLVKLADQRADGPALSYAIDLTEPETCVALVQVRLQAMETLIDFHQLTAALQQAEDVTSFRGFIKSLPMAAEAQLMSLLSQWFLATGNIALHAYLQQQLYWVTFKFNKTATAEALDKLRDAAVISTLAMSTHDTKTVEADRYLNLLRLGIMPRRQVLLAQSKARGLFEAADPTIKSIHSILEDPTSPLTLVPSIKAATSVLSPDYHCYVPFLHTVAEEVALRPLTSLYRTITLKSLQTILGFSSQSEVEKRLLTAITKGHLQAKINQHKGIVEFNQNSGLAGFCSTLSQVSALLSQFQAIIHPHRTSPLSMKDALLIAKESRSNSDKQELLEKLRKERLLEQQREEELAKKQELQSKSKADESTAALKLRADVAQQKQRLSAQRRTLYLEEIEYWVEKMQKEGFSSKEMKIKGKKIAEMTEDEKLEIGFEEFIDLHKKLFDAAKDGREEQLQQAWRQLQYQERAKREVEAAVLLQQWEEEQDSELMRLREQHRLNHQQDYALKQVFSCAQSFKSAFISEETEKARIPYEDLYQQWMQTQADLLSRSILEVAKEMREEERKRQQEQRKVEHVRKIEKDVNSKQEEAKRLLYEESRKPSKESDTAWRGQFKPEAAKRFVNTKKEEKPQTPVVTAQRKTEPEQVVKWQKNEAFPGKQPAEETKTAPFVRSARQEPATKPPEAVTKPSTTSASSGYVSRFSKTPKPTDTKK